jgi:hypothetical protein
MLRDAIKAWRREKATHLRRLRHTATNLMREAGMGSSSPPSASDTAMEVRVYVAPSGTFTLVRRGRRGRHRPHGLPAAAL